jgi:hypothetical protein
MGLHCIPTLGGPKGLWGQETSCFDLGTVSFFQMSMELSGMGMIEPLGRLVRMTGLPRALGPLTLSDLGRLIFILSPIMGIDLPYILIY